MASLVKTVPAGSARGDAPAGQRSMYLFKASVRVSAENIVGGAKEYEYAQGHAFVNNLRRYYNPFVLGPRIEIYSKKTIRQWVYCLSGAFHEKMSLTTSRVKSVCCFDPLAKLGNLLKTIWTMAFIFARIKSISRIGIFTRK